MCRENGDKLAEEGLKVQPCVGSPEPDIGITSNRLTLGPYEGTGAVELDQKQDLNDRTTYGAHGAVGCIVVGLLCVFYVVHALLAPTLRRYDFVCPSGCGSAAVARQDAGGHSGVFGNETYGDESYICAAAIHAGLISDSGGMFTLQLQVGWLVGCSLFVVVVVVFLFLWLIWNGDCACTFPRWCVACCLCSLCAVVRMSDSVAGAITRAMMPLGMSDHWSAPPRMVSSPRLTFPRPPRSRRMVG